MDDGFAAYKAFARPYLLSDECIFFQDGDKLTVVDETPSGGIFLSAYECLRRDGEPKCWWTRP